MHPELSQNEYKTSEYIQKVLKELGVEVRTGYHNTGVVGIVEGDQPGPVIGLRFDMDALAMDELAEVSYKSKTPGAMHSCGHDAHMAMGLGAAKVFCSMKDEIKGTIKLIFQPAEEDAPGGGGAQYMIRDGVLDNPKVDCMLGMHVWPGLELGRVASKPGVMMAASDPFVIKVQGKGVHASMPYMGIDPIVIGSQIVSSLQSIVSRNIDPFDQAVISVGVFRGGTRYNVIPDSVTLEGTVRTFDEETRQTVYKNLNRMVEQVAGAYGGEAVLDYNFSYPPLFNSGDVVSTVQDAVKCILGKESFLTVDRPAPGSEDFAYFSKAVPSAFMFLGTGVAGRENPPLHNPYFDLDESALAYGVKAFVKSALNLGRMKDFDRNNQ